MFCNAHPGGVQIPEPPDSRKLQRQSLCGGGHDLARRGGPKAQSHL